MIAACATPSERFFTAATRLGFVHEIVAGAPFPHVVFRNFAGPANVLHIYLDGDGVPWVRGEPGADPTPRNTLVLGLMRLDQRPSVYVGRPCHHQAPVEPDCAPLFWTDGRYSEAVVESVVRVVERLVEWSGSEALVWIGYSGGGAIAMLAAPRFALTKAVVTIGANLDTEAWADWHNYRRLDASLNPARQPPLPSRIVQRHYVGAQDRVMPASILRAAAPATVIVVPGFDHTCCWTRLWPAVLADLDRLRDEN